MKNIQIQESISERYKFIISLFKTDLLDVKEIKELVLKASQMPIFFFEYSDPSEWSHFSVWWNGIGCRHGVYENDYINDLHYIHELYHLVNKKTGYQNHESWLAQKISEEFDASVFSEMSVYVLMPSLRAKTFSFEILFDEVKDADLQNIREFRQDTIDIPWVHTAAQNLVQKYNRNNYLWGEIWKDKAEEVELRTILLNEHDIDCIKEHLKWLESNSTDGVPFKQKALEFAEKMER